MADIDPDLLRSPFDEPDPPRRRKVTVITMAIAAVVVVAGMVVWGTTRSGEPGENQAIVTTTTVGEPTEVTLVTYTGDAPFVTHPTLLPDGWDACEITEERLGLSRFCADDERWIEVGYAAPRPTDPETSIPAGIHDGVWTSEEQPLEVRFPTNEHVATVVRASGLTADQTLRIADSVPIVGGKDAFYGPYEIPIDWESMTGDDLVDLLDQFEADADVDLGRFELTVRTSNASLHGFNSRGYWTPVAATDLPMARLIEADRPLVVGAAPQLQRGYAVWDQAGFSWRLEGNLDAEEASALALSVIAKLSDLPLDLS